MTSTNISLSKKIFNTLKSLFVSGLLTLLPLALTLVLFRFLFHTLKSWLSPIYRLLPDGLRAIPLSEFFVVLIAILIVGAVLRGFFLKKFVDLVEQLFRRVPLVRQVYFGLKQLMNAFGPKDKQHFQQVVLIEFPQPGTYSLAFLTNNLPSPLPPQNPTGQKIEYLNVFLPHTPNPTSGFFLIVPASGCIRTDLSRQEAMTMIISGGIIQPDRFMQQN